MLGYSFRDFFFWNANMFILLWLIKTPSGASGKEATCQCKRCKRLGFAPWLGRFPRAESGNPLQYSFFFLIYLFYFTTLYWSCHTLIWISHGCSCVPHLEPLSHLSPHPIPLGHPSAPALYHALNLDWWFISHMIVYMFQWHSPISSCPHPLPQSPKDCSIHPCLSCYLAYRVIITIFLNSIYIH